MRLALLCATLIAFSATEANARLPFLRQDKTRLVDPAGAPVLLKGCNIGNWFLLEPWMFGGRLEARDQTDIFTTLHRRFGDQKADQLIQLYRDSWITPRDFELIKSFGFNVIRLPMHWSLLQQDQPPYQIKPDGLLMLDHALAMAENAGVYVILDLHGAPGGQSTDMPTGLVNQNHLWTDQTDQRRTAEIWAALAQRYHDRSVVAGYDLLNEPYGNFHQNLHSELRSLMTRLYSAIRLADDRHVVFFPGGLDKGIEFYGDPHANGWHDVGFTEHFYAGLFGNKPAVESHARILNQVWPADADYLDRIASPYYVGEFNVVLSACGGPTMMREYYDRLAQNGWTGTLWSYKLLSASGGVGEDSWAMVSNATPLPRLDLQNSSYENFEHFFSNLATIELAINQPLRAALTAPVAAPLLLTQYPHPPTTLPSATDSTPTGWTSTDVGGARAGRTIADGPGMLTLYAGGTDIFAEHDSFRFVSQPQQMRCDLRAQVVSLLDSHIYAKAGLMARWGDSSDAPFAMVNAFPDGSIALCSRSAAGQAATETRVSAPLDWPIQLRLAVDAAKATGFYRPPGQDWKPIGVVPVPAQPGFRAGLAATAHDVNHFTVARFHLGDDSIATSPVASPSANLHELPASWNRWGNGWSLETGGSDMIYHHPGTADGSGLWQDVAVEAGKQYIFSVAASRNQTSFTRGSTNIQLRLESPRAAGNWTLNFADYRAGQLSDAPGGTRLHVAASAPTGRLRVLITITSDARGAADDRLRLFGASLKRADD